MKTTTEEMMLWYQMHRLQERYVSVIDADRLEAGSIHRGLRLRDCPQREYGSRLADRRHALLRSRDAVRSLSEFRNAADVGVDRVGRVVAQPQFLDHSLAQFGHGETPFGSDETNR